jgi:membrane protease YdiL (CAAX protease family)
MRDLLLFFVFTALAAIHYLLKTKGTPLEAPTWLFLLMWVLSMVMLIWLRLYGGEREDAVDYDEDLNRRHLPVLVAAIAGIIVVASVIVSISGLVQSALVVPRPGAVLSQMPASAPAIIDDLLYNFVLVAPAEETMKLMGIIALYRKTRNEPLSVSVPVGIWSAFHGYYSYVGQLMWPLIAAAFAAGFILYLSMKHTRSLLNAIIVHGSYNCLVILESLLG